MRIIQGCELEGFLHQAEQAKQSLERIARYEGPIMNKELRYALIQYELLALRYENGILDTETDRKMVAEGRTIGEFDAHLIQQYNLLARATELKLGLGIAYGLNYDEIKTNKYPHQFLYIPPTLKDQESYQPLLQSDLAGLLTTVKAGPAMIHVPGQLVGYGIALGLNENRKWISEGLRAVEEHFQVK